MYFKNKTQDNCHYTKQCFLRLHKVYHLQTRQQDTHPFITLKKSSNNFFMTLLYSDIQCSKTILDTNNKV